MLYASAESRDWGVGCIDSRSYDIIATKIPAQARLALCGGGHSLKHSDPKALLSSAGVCSPPRSDIPKKIFEKKEKKERKENVSVGAV